MKTNKIISLLAAATLGVSAFTGCGASTDNNSSVDTTNSDNTISVVTTIFPEYDWVKEIVGDNDNVEVTMLLDNGVDLHNYQPTADDIMKIATNKDMQVVNLLESLGEAAKEEEVVEGMQADEEEAEAEEGEEEEVEYDEHVWLSLKNAQVLVDAIEQAIATLDADNSDTYAANASAYNDKLATLDEKYQAAIDEASVKTVLFGDRFPFRYLVDDYGIDYYAAFVGCSAETEASFETITFLAGKVDELNLNTVFTIENSDQKIAQTIIENTSAKDAQILTLDSMQSTTSEDLAAGVTYLSVMEGNLDVLSQGLN